MPGDQLARFSTKASPSPSPRSVDEMRTITACAVHSMERPLVGLAGICKDTRLFNDVLFRAKTRRREVALTLDDGPDESVTPQVLEILSSHQARATFFLIGSRVRAHRLLCDG